MSAPSATKRTDKRVDPDAEAVAGAQSGDRQAFARLVRRYQRPLFYLALRYTKNEADAKDVTQRTFVRVYQSLGTFRGSSLFRTWLYRIGINLSLNHLRDHQRERPTDIDAVADDALVTSAVGLGNLVQNERAGALRAAIEQLPPKQRLVLELRVYDELPFREVAQLADCSENAAKVNFHHAVQRLRTLMTEPTP